MPPLKKKQKTDENEQNNQPSEDEAEAEPVISQHRCKSCGHRFESPQERPECPMGCRKPAEMADITGNRSTTERMTQEWLDAENKAAQERTAQIQAQEKMFADDSKPAPKLDA